MVFGLSLMKSDPFGLESFPRPPAWPPWIGFSGLIQAPLPWRRMGEGAAPIA